MKMSSFRLISFFCLVLSFHLLSAQTEGTDHPIGTTQSTDPNYILQPNDYLQVTVFQENDLTTSTRISPTGNIVMPLIGNVKVGGLKVVDADNLICKQLMDGYLTNPQVTITMISFAPRRYSVLGQVQKPGN